MTMNIKTLLVAGFQPALKGMRNPKNSWNKIDSTYYDTLNPTMEMVNHKYIDEAMKDSCIERFLIGDNDMKLAQTLIRAGAEHMKFMRMIHVWADMNMTRFFWSEMDTYHFNTKNSCSTMHTITRRPLTISDFGLNEELANIYLNEKKEIKQEIIPIVLPKGVKEEWKDIEGFEGRYRISNKGEVVRNAVIDVYESGRVVNRGMKIIKCSVNSSGYLKLGLNKDGKYYNKFLHRLLAEHFIPNPDNLPYVNHKDGNKLNNNLNNLEWCTAQENTQHAHDNELAKVSEYNKMMVSNAGRRFDSSEVRNIKQLHNDGATIKEIAKEYKCCESIISNIITDKTYKKVEEYEFLKTLQDTIDRINTLRIQYINSTNYHEKTEIKRRIKCLLPEGFLQLRTVDTNYAEIRNIVSQRKYHELKPDWQDTFCRWATTLPYAKELIFCGLEDLYDKFKVQ